MYLYITVQYAQTKQTCKLCLFSPFFFYKKWLAVALITRSASSASLRKYFARLEVDVVAATLQSTRWSLFGQ